MRLQGRLVPAAAVSPPERDALFALMDRHYANVQRAVFEADLAEKRWVILVHNPATRAVCGFSTQTLLECEAPGRRFRALFSGDTIIDRDHWGDPALAHVWGRLALSLIDRLGGEELHWFLLSQGYKTYRFLPLFFHEFYPRHDRATPDWAKQVLGALAGARYPHAYDPAAGVVRSGPRQYRLRAGVADLTEERLLDPHVRFFAAANPGHRQGDELCCLAPLTGDNFTRAAYRVIGPAAALPEVP
jgi:hypothetical protein